MAGQGTVLVADTDQAIVEFIIEALTDEGYTVFDVYDRAATTAAILTKAPDLLLLDLGIGGIPEVDLIRGVRAWGIETPIVLMSTSQPQAEGLEGQRAVAYLLKPFSLDDLLACVATHIRTDQPPPASAA